MLNAKSNTTVDRITQLMLDRIRADEWTVGSVVPGERVLMEEFGVSRIALREALARLRALGVLDTAHGRGSVVRKIDAASVTQLVPLALALDGEQTVSHMFELRLALESRTVVLAAERRTDDDLGEIDRLSRLFSRQVDEGVEDSIVTDMEFHMAIARASHNPLFPSSLGVLTNFVRHVHTAHAATDVSSSRSEVVSDLHGKYVRTLDCTNDPVRWQRAVFAHEAIAEAIRDRDGERARAEMEAHLRYSVLRILQSGVPTVPRISDSH